MKLEAKMKTMKRLLLGGAAGVIAVSGVQAADLPVKAKAVEYVKVCSLYGEGFFYMPGTDTCLKIGGYLRAEVDHNAGGTFAPGVSPSNGALQHVWGYDRTSDSLVTRTRQLFTFDARSQTDYGTLRSYARVGIQWTTGDPISAGTNAPAYLDRAFIQWAGFTFGKAVSFYDSYVFGIHSYQTGIIGSEGTAGNGTPMVAYTVQFGNGLSATAALEDSYARSRSISNVNGAGYWSVNAQSVFNGGPPSAQAGYQISDPVLNLRLDQAWGMVSASVAAHRASGLYYGSAGNVAPGGGDPGFVTNGGPDPKWGYAAQIGAVLNLPWNTGDTFGFQVAYGVGALGFVDDGATGSFVIFNGGSIGLGFMTDGVYGGTSAANGSALELTTAWAATAGVEHYWTPTLRTSLYGGYTAISYDATATALICTGAGLANLGKGAGFTPSNCSPDFAFWQIGSRTIWNPVKNLDLGVEIMYNNLHSGFGGNAIVNAAVAEPTQNFLVKDQNVVAAIFRAQRNFWP
jgi:hypothetical protein